MIRNGARTSERIRRGPLHPARRVAERASWLAFALVVLAAVLAVLLTYRDYGITWDESVQKHYGELVVAYFRSFERRQDRHANFRDTFGQSLEHFELEVLAHLKSLVR